MQKNEIKGTTENLNILNNKVDFIGFKLGEVPEFLKEFEPLNFRVPKVYDDTTYKTYKYVPIKDIEILITPTNRLEELSERYRLASPLFTYMSANVNDNLDKYAYFLKMINQTKIEEIEEIEEEQTQMENKIPFEVKFNGNFKWQVYYSEYAKKYFMLASTNEMDNSPLFYLIKKRIIDYKENQNSEIFIPISNEEYSEKILKKSDISDLENYLWFFTKNWPSIYEVTDKNGETTIQIVGETPVYDKMISKYKLVFDDKKEAMKEYKLIKALFILSYDIPNEYSFRTKIDENGGIDFYYENELIIYDKLSEFLNEEAKKKINDNTKLKLETKDLKADIKDLQKHSEKLNEEYLKQERQIYAFLECKKTFFGKVKYFFKSKKVKTEGKHSQISKSRLKDILIQDKEENKIYEEEDVNKLYTVEDIIKICQELNNNKKENKNVKSDIKALNNKIENLNRKIKNATQYIEEIEKHKKSIFEFWRFANKDEVKSIAEGEKELDRTEGKLKKTFDYEEDIETLANNIDSKQRDQLSQKEFDATFAANFVLDGINIVSKKVLLKEDEEKIAKLLDTLKLEYKEDIDKIEDKDFDIFGNVSQDKTKIKVLKNSKHRESQKDKFKILNINLDTQLIDFKKKLKDLKEILVKESNKIEIPYNVSLYKASYTKMDSDGFSKFNLSPYNTLEEIKNESTNKEVYLYKINVPEKTNIIFYSNIMFYENNNKTLPLGMDISQQTLINMDLYTLELKNKEDFNINVENNMKENFVRNVKVYEYDIKKK